MKSFAARTRDALTREDSIRPIRDCCRLAELSGFALACGTVSLVGGGGFRLSMRTENAGTARWAVKRLRGAFAVTPGLRIAHASRLGGRNTFEIRLEQQDAEKVLKALGLSPLDMKIPRHCMTKKCCQSAFLRGVFLGCGVLQDPERGYRMEFVFACGETARALSRFLQAFHGIHAGVSERKGAFVAYVKDADSIVFILSRIGAHSALLELENVRITKEARNRANRAANCDAANITKMLGAADRHMKAIDRIERTIGLSALPDTLREVAVERKKHADISLEELGALLDPKVGKSGVYHRLSRIEAIARSIERQEEEGLS